jgi:hypothetical protein
VAEPVRGPDSPRGDRIHALAVRLDGTLHLDLPWPGPPCGCICPTLFAIMRHQPYRARSRHHLGGMEVGLRRSQLLVVACRPDREGSSPLRASTASVPLTAPAPYSSKAATRLHVRDPGPPPQHRPQRTPHRDIGDAINRNLHAQPSSRKTTSCIPLVPLFHRIPDYPQLERTTGGPVTEREARLAAVHAGTGPSRGDPLRPDRPAGHRSDVGGALGRSHESDPGRTGQTRSDLVVPRRPALLPASACGRTRGRAGARPRRLVGYAAGPGSRLCPGGPRHGAAGRHPGDRNAGDSGRESAAPMTGWSRRAPSAPLKRFMTQCAGYGSAIHRLGGAGPSSSTPARDGGSACTTRR